MTKPMYCPMSFANDYIFNYGAKECNPDCAWSVNDGEEYWCGIINDQIWHVNARPLKDDDE